MAASNNDMLSSLTCLGIRLFQWALLGLSTRVRVEGDSMAPALSNGDRLLVSRLAYRLEAPARGDIVLLRDPSRPGSECIKRILALPGETVRLDGLIASVQPASVDGGPAGAGWTLGGRDYFLVGDNLAHSTDSRSWGPVGQSAILGRAWYCYASSRGPTGVLR
jgi:signal peptidase I